jgi:hypothetical protein
MGERPIELRAILDSAQQAASAEDFASAERYLRQAADLQEAQLGPGHLDLANTLNNLGIVCERSGKPDDAEVAYRRAYAIATSSLPADDPLVLTSGQNLKDFCAAAGKPFELPRPSPLKPVPSPTPVPTPGPQIRPAPVSPPAPIAATPPPPKPSKVVTHTKPGAAKRVEVVRSAIPAEVPHTSPARRATGVVAAGLALVLASVLVGWLFRSDDESPASATEPPATPAAAPASVEPPSPPPPARERGAVEPPAPRPEPPATRAPRRNRPASVSLVEARLCRTLSSNWQCMPATSPAQPGPLVFYTRVKSASDTAVQHRWYQNGTLRRSAELNVAANMGAGYRTYSRITVSADRRGDWTIEVRDDGGALLHEERFVIQ